MNNPKTNLESETKPQISATEPDWEREKLTRGIPVANCLNPSVGIKSGSLGAVCWDRWFLLLK